MDVHLHCHGDQTPTHGARLKREFGLKPELSPQLYALHRGGHPTPLPAAIINLIISAAGRPPTRQRKPGDLPGHYQVQRPRRTGGERERPPGRAPRG